MFDRIVENAKVVTVTERGSTTGGVRAVLDERRASLYAVAATLHACRMFYFQSMVVSAKIHQSTSFVKKLAIEEGIK